MKTYKLKAKMWVKFGKVGDNCKESDKSPRVHYDADTHHLYVHKMNGKKLCMRASRGVVKGTQYKRLRIHIDLMDLVP